jgi:hypothetical protein
MVAGVLGVLRHSAVGRNMPPARNIVTTLIELSRFSESKVMRVSTKLSRYARVAVSRATRYFEQVLIQCRVQWNVPTGVTHLSLPCALCLF